MKLIIALFALLLLIVFGISLSQNYFKTGIFPFSKTPTATVNNQKFNLLIPKTTSDKEIGLSKYSSLPQNTGMLFIFERADFYSFWMRDMKFPIDIIFIKGDKIATIYENVQPPKSKDESIPLYKPTSASDKVLEINANLSKKYNIKEGNTVKIENL
ncbi:MAG: DUF192 domain-containing protein [Candidatus Levybacteria bacterium]|nr:DUF192 domain-containing protein [Candidatus Levybacteria bacterium]